MLAPREQVRLDPATLSGIDSMAFVGIARDERNIQLEVDVMSSFAV